MKTFRDAINKMKAKENVAYDKLVATHGKPEIIDIKTFIDVYENGSKMNGKKAFIYARDKMCEVSHVRWPETNPWVVCPKENAGFGLSYCVHYGDRLFIV